MGSVAECNIRRKPQRIWPIEGKDTGNLRQGISKYPRLPAFFLPRIDFAGYRRFPGSDWTWKVKESQA
jgi:hypothetical protein